MGGFESSDPETGRGDQDDFIAPTLGMFCAAEVFLRVGPVPVRIAPDSTTPPANRCVFHHAQLEVQFHETGNQSYRANQGGERDANTSSGFIQCLPQPKV